MANADSASSSIDQTYRARKPVFAEMLEGSSQTSVGVEVMAIVESDAPLRREYQPNHPQADETGYVYMPNVNTIDEMADMIAASRSFQLNAEMANTAKSMMQRLLTLGQ